MLDVLQYVGNHCNTVNKAHTHSSLYAQVCRRSLVCALANRLCIRLMVRLWRSDVTPGSMGIFGRQIGKQAGQSISDDPD